MAAILSGSSRQSSPRTIARHLLSWNVVAPPDAAAARSDVARRICCSCSASGSSRRAFIGQKRCFGASHQFCHAEGMKFFRKSVDNVLEVEALPFTSLVSALVRPKSVADINPGALWMPLVIKSSRLHCENQDKPKYYRLHLFSKNYAEEVCAKNIPVIFFGHDGSLSNGSDFVNEASIRGWVFDSLNLPRRLNIFPGAKSELIKKEFEVSFNSLQQNDIGQKLVERYHALAASGKEDALIEVDRPASMHFNKSQQLALTSMQTFKGYRTQLIN